MANVFNDIFEAIRIIRQQKGVRESDIMSYVHDRLGKDVTIRTVLKILRTLNRLVDCGLLLKKGGRYYLPLPPSNDQEDTDCEGMEDEDEAGDKDDEEEEDDDCDDDEDDEDEDDDDDDEEQHKCTLNDQSMDEKDKKGEEGKAKDRCELNDDVESHRQEESANWDYRHIDTKMKRSMMRSDLNPVAGSFIRSKKHRYEAHRNRLCNEDLFDYLPQEKSRNQIDSVMDVEDFHESEGRAQFNNHDLSIGCEEVDSLEGYECKYKSPNGSPPPNTPGVYFDRKESCCSDIVPKVDDLATTQDKPDFQGDGVSVKQPEEEEKQVEKDEQGKILTEDVSDDTCNEEKTLSCDNSEEIPNDQMENENLHCELSKRKKTPGHFVQCIHKAGKW